MVISFLTREDRKQIENHGLSLEQVKEQIEIFRRGTPYVRLLRPCTHGDGISLLKEEQHPELLKLHEHAAKSGRLMKFVPASGAASRMFKNLTWFYQQPDHMRESLEERAGKDEKFEAIFEVLSNLKKFAFYQDLKRSMAKDGLSIEEMVSCRDFQTILVYLLTEKGLDYNRLPKALLKFHCYGDESRTALEEHLVETLDYGLGQPGNCRIHFTTSPNHKKLFQDYIRELRTRYESKLSNLDVILSEQPLTTDTLAVNMDNRPFRDKNGQLVFRPGGHGALLGNLNRANGNIVFLKNVDNVAIDKEKGATFLYQKLLTGYLIKLQNNLFKYLQVLEKKEWNSDLIDNISEFCRTVLNIPLEDNYAELNDSKKAAILFQHLNRPIRVCGVVENRGEAGGGPFWIVDFDGKISPQIVEISQIDKNSPTQVLILESATHFNPVFIACGVRDYKGKQFNLFDFSDPRTVFITTKYIDGRELKALEWPGLWNGSMAYWNTIFVEVPSKVFNPVKNINDLLKKRHCN